MVPTLEANDLLILQERAPEDIAGNDIIVFHTSLYDEAPDVHIRICLCCPADLREHEEQLNTQLILERYVVRNGSFGREDEFGVLGARLFPTRRLKVQS